MLCNPARCRRKRVLLVLKTLFHSRELLQRQIALAMQAIREALTISADRVQLAHTRARLGNTNASSALRTGLLTRRAAHMCRSASATWVSQEPSAQDVRRVRIRIQSVRLRAYNASQESTLQPLVALATMRAPFAHSTLRPALVHLAWDTVPVIPGFEPQLRAHVKCALLDRTASMGRFSRARCVTQGFTHQKRAVVQIVASSTASQFRLASS